MWVAEAGQVVRVDQVDHLAPDQEVESLDPGVAPVQN